MNPLSERALIWLEKFVASRRSAHAASRELGHDGNWAGRLLSRTANCNWNYREISKMAERLGMTALELEAAIREGIVPAGLPKIPKLRAKPRRAAKPRKMPTAL